MEKVGAVMVVGAGIGGSQSALDLADSGYKVYLIESTTSIGGVMAQLDKTFPTNDCAMCIVSPKLVETGRHQNIDLSINCEIQDVSGEAGNFTVKVLKKTLYINKEKCTGCGVCGRNCPVEAIDIFNEGLAKYSATSVKYPQAVPLLYAINKDYCIGCGICQGVCKAKAVEYDLEDEVEEISVGAIVLAPGFDEYIPPYVIGNYDGVRDNDCILHTNYRQDRAIQLSMAFVDPKYPGKLKTIRHITYVGLTRYWDEFANYMLGAIDAVGGMEHLLGEVISHADLRQLRIAETQKFRHVTSFFNGKATTPYPNEDQVEVPSRFDPATFASHPEMEAYNVTDELLRRLRNNPYHFIAVNFANGDMVGHTSNLEAATKAIEVVDDCIGRIVDRLLEIDAHILITSDHGNSEQMFDDQTGMTKTSHTLNPVEVIYLANDSQDKRLIGHGKLSDIAPTVLFLLGLDIPKEMTAQNLIVNNAV